MDKMINSGNNQQINGTIRIIVGLNPGPNYANLF